MAFKPMLAATIEDIGTLSYPLLASPKLDGIRCIVIDGKALTRNLKPIPNKFIREFLESLKGVDGFDGEIMIRTGDFNRVQSAVMSEDGEPDFYYAVFDLHSEGNLPFTQRLKTLSEKVKKLNNKRISLLEQVFVDSTKELLSFESECIEDGYEGVILRRGDSSYKCGRSTLREGKLMKLKRFNDAEAEIISIEPLYENRNVAIKNALGHTERSSHQENLVAQSMLGSMQVQLKNGKEFSIGTGFDDDTRKEYWVNRKKLVGKMVKFKYQELSSDGIPRFPVFLGMRDKGDI